MQSVYSTVPANWATFSPGYQATLVYMEMKGQTEPQKKHSWQIYTIQKFHTLTETIINKFIFKKLQKSRDDQTQNKLDCIQDTIDEWLTGYRRKKKISDTLPTLYWPYPHCSLTPPKKRDPPPAKYA